MPVKSRIKSHSFNDSYYWDKICEKRTEVSNHLKQNPQDEVARKQLQFINHFLKEVDKNNWPAIWNDWERNDFCWPDTRDIKNGK